MLSPNGVGMPNFDDSRLIVWLYPLLTVWRCSSRLVCSKLFFFYVRFCLALFWIGSLSSSCNESSYGIVLSSIRHDEHIYNLYDCLVSFLIIRHMLSVAHMLYSMVFSFTYHTYLICCFLIFTRKCLLLFWLFISVHQGSGRSLSMMGIDSGWIRLCQYRGYDHSMHHACTEDVYS